MSIFIYLCILFLNIISIVLIYNFLGKTINKRNKGIFIIVGTAIMYGLVTLVYTISSRNLNLGVNCEKCKNLIIFSFVPLNSICILPYLAKSYCLWKNKKLKLENYKKRCIVLAIILVLLLVLEFFYFQDIQTRIVSILQNTKTK